MDKKELDIVLEIIGEDLRQRIDINKVTEDMPPILKPIINQFLQKLDNLNIYDIIKMYNTDDVLVKINNKLEGMI